MKKKIEEKCQAAEIEKKNAMERLQEHLQRCNLEVEQLKKIVDSKKEEMTLSEVHNVTQGAKLNDIERERDEAIKENTKLHVEIAQLHKKIEEANEKCWAYENEKNKATKALNDHLLEHKATFESLHKSLEEKKEELTVMEVHEYTQALTITEDPEKMKRQIAALQNLWRKAKDNETGIRKLFVEYKFESARKGVNMEKEIQNLKKEIEELKGNKKPAQRQQTKAAPTAKREKSEAEAKEPAAATPIQPQGQKTKATRGKKKQETMAANEEQRSLIKRIKTKSRAGRAKDPDYVYEQIQKASKKRKEPEKSTEPIIIEEDGKKTKKVEPRKRIDITNSPVTTMLAPEDLSIINKLNDIKFFE